MSLTEADIAPLDRLAAALSPQPAELVAAVRLAARRDLSDVLESPERLRRLTVQTLLNDRRPVPADPIEGLPDELVDLAQRIAALPCLERVVLVLLDLEQLTRAEVAGIVDRPAATVRHLQDRVYAELGADPYAVAAVLAALSWRPVDPVAVRRAEVRLVWRHRTRTRRRGLITVAALVAVAAVVLPGVLRTTTTPPVFVRDHRDWVLSYRLTPPPGYQIESRTVGADVETAAVNRTPGIGGCQVTVGRSVDDAPTSAVAGRAVRVQGRPARLVADRAGQARLRWQPGPGLSADIACSAMVDAEPFALQLATKMIFEAEPILLPYRLGPLPSHFHVDQVTVRPSDHATVVDLWPDEVAPTGVPIAVTQTDGGQGPRDVPALSAYGMSACQLVDAVSVCAGFAAPGAPDAPTEQTRTQQRLKMIMTGLAMAPSGSDRSTWTDARVGLPRD